MTRSRDTASIIPTVDAKGDLLVGTADNTIDNLSPGTNGQVLTANSATASGLEWANGSTNITTLGTVTSGTWNASTISVGSGGTGATTLASGGYLKGAGTSAITSQSGIPAGDITSGTLGVGRGGTGATTFTSGAYLKGAGTSAVTAQSGIPAGDITSGILPVVRGGTGRSDSVLPFRVHAGAGTVAVNGFATVTFPGGRFTAQPAITVTRVQGSLGSYETPIITSSDANSFTVYINFGEGSFNYIAIQM